MTPTPDHNWLIIAGALFALSGTALLGKAFLSYLDAPQSGALPETKRNEARVASWLGLPMLGLGFFSQAAGQVATASLSPLVTSFMLALAFTLLLYGMLESSFVDHLSQSAHITADPPRMALPAPHRLEAIEHSLPSDDVILLKSAATA